MTRITEPRQRETARRPSPATSRTLGAALALVLLAGAALRLYGVNFGLPALLDPDELIFGGGMHQLITSGTLNPGWFGHPGTTTIYVLTLVAAGVLGTGLASGSYPSVDAFVQAIIFKPELILSPARMAMVAFAVLSLWLIYRLGARLNGRITGFVAALLLAFNTVHISWSQVVRSDIMALTFLLAAALASARFLDLGRRRDMVLACLATALAITSKWPFAVAYLSIIGALILRQQALTGQTETLTSKVVGLIKPVVLSAVLVLIFTLAISPYLLLDYPTFLKNLQGEAKISHLGATSTGAWGNLVFYLSGPVWRGLGPVGCVFAVAGLVLSLRHKRFWALAVFPALFILGVILTQAVVWDRWAIPLFPALSLAAGIAADRLWRKISKLGAVSAGSVAAALILAALTPLVLTSFRAAEERLHDNRRLATDWARSNLPEGSVIMVEHFAFDLVDSPFPVLFPIGSGGCFDARGVLSGKLDYKLVDSLRGGHSNLDYAAIPKDKLESCKADFAILTEYARYAADAKLFAEGHQQYQDLIKQGRVMARFPFVPGKVGGRPEVMVLDLRP